MTEDVPERFFLGTRNHFVVTPTFVGRGTVIPCHRRLSDHLRSLKKPFFELHDVEVLPMAPDAEAEIWPTVHVAMEAVILAHEYVEMGGDRHLKSPATDASRLDATLLLEGIPTLRVEGRLHPSALAQDARFVVVTDPAVHGSHEDALRVAEETRSLPYLIVNRSRIDSVMLKTTPPEGTEEDA